jgi:hypothetical protein
MVEIGPIADGAIPCDGEEESAKIRIKKGDRLARLGISGPQFGALLVSESAARIFLVGTVALTC